MIYKDKEYINFLKGLEKKKVFILTKSLQNKYVTSDLKVLPECVIFTDRNGQSVMVSLSDIEMIAEARK